jgi:hypothetical protein
LTISTSTPDLASAVTPDTFNLIVTTFKPTVLPFNIVYLDPGGDATQAVGHFNTPILGFGADAGFDTTRKVAGVGSYRFDSGADENPAVKVAGVLDDQRRISCYFHYDSVPDVTHTASGFATTGPSAYSGGGFTNQFLMQTGDNGDYGLATPDQNQGQGTVFGSFGLDAIPPGAIIDSVKIIYEWKVDTVDSEPVSRVKWLIDGEEGPNHDNTDMPLVDTVVEVDVTADRPWERKDLLSPVFEVIAEARRGDTDTAHTQSWDYVKVAVVYHPATVILAIATSSDFEVAQVAITPSLAGVRLKFLDGAGNTFEGITDLLVDTWYRLAFSYSFNTTNDLSARLYIDGILELSLTEVSTAGVGILTVNRLHYGWLVSPGVDHVCWFDQLYIDAGDDLSDPGDIRSTAKLPAAVNDGEWTTTVGTGAVDERPLSITNYVKHTLTSTARQTYTLQAADTGDTDISGETVAGYMGWAWAKVQFDDFWDLALVVNGADVDRTNQISPTVSLLRHAVTSSTYPSDPAGIGMAGSNEAPDTYLYECGAVVAYRGPNTNPNRLLAYQELAEGTILDIVDDLRAAVPSSYEFCYRSSDPETAAALITVTSLDHDGGNIYPQVGTTESPMVLHGGGGRSRIFAGVEVQIHLEVVGGPISIELWHRLNVD